MDLALTAIQSIIIHQLISVERRQKLAPMV